MEELSEAKLYIRNLLELLQEVALLIPGCDGLGVLPLPEERAKLICDSYVFVIDDIIKDLQK